MYKKVIFQNTMYWLTDNIAMPNTFNISPLDHFDDRGNFLAPYGSISYAIIETGLIKRFGEVIGKESDLIEVTG